MIFSTDDRRHMVRAIQLAALGLNTAHPNPRVGCVIAAGPVSLGEGWHERTGEAHAEVRALAQAGVGARGATAYISLEPCCHVGRTPPCTVALINAGISRVVYAAGDPNPLVNGQGEQALQAAGIAVAGGLLAAEAQGLNWGFRQRITRGWPLVRTKIATSLDGRTALADGRSQWLTGPSAREDVQRWRAQSGALLTGVGTVLADDPALTVREQGRALPLQPLRVVLDSSLRTPPTARVLAEPGAVLLFGAGSEVKLAALMARGAGVESGMLQGGRADLLAVLRRLGELEINEVWVEAGATLNGSLLAAGLIDELVVYQASSVLGNSARGMFDTPALSALPERPEMRLQSVRRVGEDLRLIYVPALATGRYY